MFGNGLNRKRALGIAAVIATGTLVAGHLLAQPQPRRHTATTAGNLDLEAATQAPIAPNRVTVTIEGDRRIIRSNSIAEHATGPFPNAGNPNDIVAQAVEWSLPLAPEVAGQPTPYMLGTFGIAVNGVIFEPQAAEWYLGDFGSAWQYDPLGGAIPLGLDEHHAHVQPDGTYHYHGLPIGLMQELGVSPDAPSPLIGWAMDGFPIYGLYAEMDGAVVEVTSSYQLKDGGRPGGAEEPAGAYDGAFLEDWDYVAGSGDLDACNGMRVTTAEFPQGTYAYFLTEAYPVVPRCFSGTPVAGALPQRGAGADRQAGEPQGEREAGPRGGDPLTKAAADLGVSVDALRRAVGPPPPDFRRAARELGIDEETIRRAMRNARR